MQKYWYYSARAKFTKYTTFEHALQIIYKLKIGIEEKSWVPIRHGWEPMSKRYFRWPTLIHFLARNPIDSLLDDEENCEHEIKIVQFIKVQDAVIYYLELDSRLLIEGRPHDELIQYVINASGD